MSSRLRVVVAVVAALLLGGVAVGYAVVTADRESGVVPAGLSVAAGPRILVRSTAPGSAGRLATVDTADPGGRRQLAGVSCNRVYAAGGTALCLRPDGPLATYQIVVFGAPLEQQQAYPIVGLPNRARVSPSGRLVTWTAFVTGDSYNNGRFSTRVGILDVRTGEAVQSLEDFAITRDGRPYEAADVNFWGVTFGRDDNTFYATMASGGRRSLMVGDLRARTVRALADNVECPALSPDGRRIAYKQARGGNPAKGWRLSVLDLSTMDTAPLAETRSVDDQAAWLDDHTVLYGLPRGPGRSDVWGVPADGTGTPRLLIPDAESPAPLG